jgi:hypothetical protein
MVITLYVETKRRTEKMDHKAFIRECPGYCVTAGKNCQVLETVECSKQTRILELIEDTKAVKGGLWFIEILD